MTTSIPSTLAIAFLTASTLQLGAQVPVGDAHAIYDLHGAANDYGYKVVRAGDLNGDGVVDVAVGCPGQAHGTALMAGMIELRSGDDGRLLGRICGTEPNEILGAFLVAVGDVDADGTPDLLTIAGLRTREVRVYSGRSGMVLRRWRAATPDAAPGVVGAAGDVNRDGHADFVVGAVVAEVAGQPTGSAFVVSGKDNRTLRRIDGVVPDSLFGRAVGSPGDVNRDGYPDIVITAMSENRPSLRRTGAVRVYSGKDGALLWVHYGPFERAYLGIYTRRAGDTNGDGHPDVLVSGYFKPNVPGIVTLLSGKDGTELRRVPTRAGRFPSMQAYDGIGDIDGDGASDYAVADSVYPATTDSHVLVYSGRTGAVLRHWTGFREQPNTLDAIGDVNGDGATEIIIGHGTPPSTTGARADGTATLVSTKALSLIADVREIDLCKGGEQKFRLRAGTAHAGEEVWFLGSVSGVAPGFPLGRLHIPLRFDIYTAITASSRGLIRFPGGTRLDAAGHGEATLDVPALPFGARLTVHHAFVTLGPGGLTFVSNAAPLRLTR